jgi:hypothetical protein
MKQRLYTKFREKCPRAYKIIDKTVEMAGWTPIILMVYSQILLLSYAYYKSDYMRHNNIDK